MRFRQTDTIVLLRFLFEAIYISSFEDLPLLLHTLRNALASLVTLFPQKLEVIRRISLAIQRGGCG